MLILRGAEQIRERVGTELGVSDWIEISQAEVDQFADLTNDHQWVHVDVEKAAASPFGGTILHGFFTLSLAARLQRPIFEFQGFGFGLNYGLNTVRFPAPMPVGRKLRMRAQLTAAENIPGGLHIVVTYTFERDNDGKPVCVAESIVRVYEPAD